MYLLGALPENKTKGLKARQQKHQEGLEAAGQVQGDSLFWHTSAAKTMTSSGEMLLHNSPLVVIGG